MSFRRRRRRRRRASGSRQAKRLHVYDRRNRHTVQAREAARGAERGTLAPTGSGLSGNCGRAPTATTTPHSPRSRSGPPTTVARLRRSCLLCTVCPAGGYARGSYPGVTRARGVARCVLGGWPGTCYHRHHGIPRRVPRCPSAWEYLLAYPLVGCAWGLVRLQLLCTEQADESPRAPQGKGADRLDRIPPGRLPSTPLPTYPASLNAQACALSSRKACVGLHGCDLVQRKGFEPLRCVKARVLPPQIAPRQRYVDLPCLLCSIPCCVCCMSWRRPRCPYKSTPIQKPTGSGFSICLVAPRPALADGCRVIPRLAVDLGPAQRGDCTYMSYTASFSGSRAGEIPPHVSVLDMSSTFRPGSLDAILDFG